MDVVLLGKWVHVTNAISKANYEVCPHNKRENGILTDEMGQKKDWEPLLETLTTHFLSYF